jgi:NAD(P)-dependent dehydrogenase (short-subunit alcohol dehydrogenase family)
MTKDYDGQRAYGASKTAQIWHSNHLNRLYGPKGVHAISIHPGGIYTGLVRHQTDEAMAAIKNNTELNQQMKNVEQGAATTVFAAVSPIWEGKGGVYLADCGPTEKTNVLGGPLHNGYAPWAFDEGYEKQLWDVSLEMTGTQPA